MTVGRKGHRPTVTEPQPVRHAGCRYTAVSGAAPPLPSSPSGSTRERQWGGKVTGRPKRSPAGAACGVRIYRRFQRRPSPPFVILGLDPRIHAARHVPHRPRFHPTFSPPRKSGLHSSHPAEGYAARRGSQAGSALVMREGRAPSSQGSAENGLPPAIRGIWRGCRTGPAISPDKFGGRACGAHKGIGFGAGDVRGVSPGLPGAMEDGADRQPWLRQRKSEGVHGAFRWKGTPPFP